MLPYLALLRVGFTKPTRSPEPLVSSYLTVSPLPDTGCRAVCSLLHWPSGYPDWTLSSTLSYGARTFLPGIYAGAAARSALRFPAPIL